MLYWLKVPLEFTQADGYAVMLPHPDPAEHLRVRDEAKNRGIERWDVPMVVADFKTALSWFLKNLPYKQDKDGKPEHVPDFVDITFISDILRAMRKPYTNGVFSYYTLDKSTKEWLADTLRREGAYALQATSRILYEAVIEAVEYEDGKSPVDISVEREVE
jgi:bifunctional pyridoxal-dependent enzyme with beta-cystathionase and maltose regulon repressor activities